MQKHSISALGTNLKKKLIKPVILGAIMCSTLSFSANAGWSVNNNIWHYTYDNGVMAAGGIQQINGINYMFDGTGNMLTGWQQTSSGWMYMNPVSGAMAKGWHQIDGKWYCFNELGLLYTNCTTPDGYYVDANGVWNEGSGSSSSNTVTNNSGQKTLQELYQENFNNGTFTDYSNGSASSSYGGVSTSLGNYGSSSDDSDDAEAKSLEEYSESELYKMITGSYTSKTDPTKGYSDDEAIEAVVYLVNILRSKKGLNEVVMDDTLMEAAQVRAEEASEKFSHTRPDGSDCFTALDEAGWPQDTHAAENLAQGQKTALQVVNAWYHSSGHKHNMLHEKNGTIGVGIYGSGYSTTWSQFFSE